MLIYRMREFARRLVVPEAHYGAARRLLRDKIAAHDIHFTGKRSIWACTMSGTMCELRRSGCSMFRCDQSCNVRALQSIVTIEHRSLPH